MPRPWFFVLLLLTLLLLLVFWMSVAEVDRVVRADGRIVPAAKRQLIQHLEGGIVSEILVREGDFVHQGENLVVITDSRADSQLGERRVRISGLRGKVERLTAEAEGKKIWGSGRVVGDAALLSEGRLFEDRQEKLRQELQVLGEQLRQRNAELQEFELRRTSLTSELDTAQRQLEVLTGLAAKNAASQLEVLEAQGRVQRIQTSLRDTEAGIPKLRSGIHEAEARTRETEARFRAEARAELAAAEMELSSASEGSKAESDRVARTEIKAPVDGFVNRLFINTLGGVVKPGEPVVELTPANKRVVVEGKVRPPDRAELHEGLPVNVRFSSYDSSTYGTVPGRLTEVSPDTVMDERGDANYRVQVEVDVENSSLRQKLIAPGMTVTADIVIGKRTVMEYLLSPVRRFSRQAFREAR